MSTLRVDKIEHIGTGKTVPTDSISSYKMLEVIVSDTDVVVDPSTYAGSRFVGTLLSDVLVTIPDDERAYLFVNETSGDFELSVTTESGSSMIVPQGQSLTLFSNGSQLSVMYDHIVSDSFPMNVSDNTILYSLLDLNLYIKRDGVWDKTAQPMLDSLDNHVQTTDAHGLKAEEVSIGTLSLASGTRGLAIGYNARSNSSFALGRDVDVSESPFSIGIGREVTVSATNSTTFRANTAIGRNVTVVDSVDTQVIGSDNTASECDMSFVAGDGNNVSGLTTSLVMGKNNQTLNALNSIIFHLDAVGNYPTANQHLDGCVVLGPGARVEGGTLSTPMEDCLSIGTGARTSANGAMAIGRASKCDFLYSTAIGYGAQATAQNQVMIGRSVETVEVPGDFNVSGTKNFSIPHPVPEKKETHKLRHASYEGPVAGGTIYRYTVETVSNKAKVDLPEYFRYLNKDEQVWCSPNKHFGQAYGEIVGNELTVTSNQDGVYEILILATRNDEGVANWKGVEVANGDT